jgi:diguanylate cyclase (GGDEF)-like protein
VISIRNSHLAKRLAGARPSVFVKLFLVATLSAIAVAVLAVAALHFASVTETAANRLYEDGFQGVESTGRLQGLLEQHRRIVESAPAEVERKRLEATQRAMIEKSSQLSVLLKELIRQRADPIADQLEEDINKKLPLLVQAGQDVMFFAYNFAQDKAIENAVIYSKAADDIQLLINDYRTRRLAIADAAVQSLLDAARSLFIWVSVSAVAAVLLIGPFGLTITHGVLSRIARITNYMSRLASHKVEEEVPSRSDRDEVGDMSRAVQVFRDNAVELMHRKTQLEQLNLHLDAALNNMSHGLCMFDASGKLIVCNGRYQEMYGLPSELTRPGTSLTQIVDYRNAAGTLGESIQDAMADARVKESGFIKHLPDGRIIAVSQQAMSDGGWVAVHEDVTERRQTEARISYLARHDQLTGLPNRVYFHEQLEEAIRHAKRGKAFAVLCFDLDRFKAVNDTLGHPVGDAVLSLVGERLKTCIRPNDWVARVGGDEFAIIQNQIERPEDSCDLAARVIEIISTPFIINDHHIVIGTSVGIALSPSDGVDSELLLKKADLAMYRAKTGCRGSYRLFEAAMDDRVQARRALELDLRHALNSDELQLFYQPLVNPRTRKVTSFEALLRWFHPKHGPIPPSEFIPLAEETGIIVPLGDWVLRAACAEALKWPSDIRLAVNLSPVQFRNGNLSQSILSALAASGLPAHRLELEITESVLLEEDARTLAWLHQLRDLGVRIALDDFGTGYSSLSYLRRFPLDKIKIDQSFIRDLTKGNDSIAIVRAIINLAQTLNISVVAEGVETLAELTIVLDEGCTEVQGHYFGAAKPANNVPEMLALCSQRVELAA